MAKHKSEVRDIEGLFAYSHSESMSSNKWSGTLRMGKRLTKAQETRANRQGDYIQPVRLNYAKV